MKIYKKHTNEFDLFIISLVSWHLDIFVMEPTSKPVNVVIKRIWFFSRQKGYIYDIYHEMMIQIRHSKQSAHAYGTHTQTHAYGTHITQPTEQGLMDMDTHVHRPY